MFRWVRRALAPPVFEGDVEKTRAAWLLNIILFTLIARAIVIRLITGPEPPRPSFVVPFVALLLVMMAVMRVGRVRLASAITIGGFWLSLSAAAVVTGGLHSAGFRNFILPVIVAGLLLGRTASITTAAASILAGIGMWVAELNGLIAVDPESASDVELLITHSISLMMAAVLVTLATQKIEESLERAHQEIAVRNQAERAVRSSEERFSKAFNLSPLRMGILRIRDAIVLDVNECWVRDMGFRREQIVGQSLFAQTAWVGEEIPRLRQLLEAGQPVRNWEGTSTTRSGEKRSALLSTEMIELGGEPCLLWVAVDITDRKRSEEALRESEELFRTSFENATTGVCLVGTDGKFLSVNHTLCDMLGYSRNELEGMSFNDVTPDEDKHIGTTFVSKALGGEVSSAHLEKHYLHKDGHALWAQVSTALVHRPNGKPYFISHIQDITARKQAEKERVLLMRDLAKRIKELTAVHRTASLLLEERLSDEELLREMAAVLPPAWQYPEVCEARISYGNMVVQTGRWRETAWTQSENLMTSNAVAGSITVAYLEQRPTAADGPFLVEERHLLRSLADMLAAHFERKRAGEQIKATSEQLRALMTDLRSAREEEGIRIAREIHDELGSALTSLRWDLEEIERITEDGTEPSRQSALRSKIATMFGLVESTVDVVRRISSELRPSVLDDLGLASAVEWQVQQFQRRTGIVVHYECLIETLSVDAEQSTAVFRIFQEALTNVLRHAQASRIDVSIEEDASDFLLTVRDNGRGIQNAEKNSPSALGLLGMRERAHLIGGQLEIAGASGRGTTVTLRVPYQRLSGAVANA